MRSHSNKKQNKDNTQFLETPRTNRRSLREKEKLSEDIKAKYIQQLEQRNRKLKYEIIKINQMLDEQKEKPHVKKQHRLIPNESSSEVLKKELDNVYKQIKNYEKQIRNLENKQAGGMITDKMSRVQNILKEKTSHLDKLKIQLSVLTKTSLDNSKKLKDNAGKEQLQNSMLKYNGEIKVLREKVRESENRQRKKAQNAKKQFDYIKKLERELIENGVAIDQIEDLKKNNIFNHIYEKMKEQKNNDSIIPQNKSQKSRVNVPKEDQVEDMTLDRFKELKNQINLYKKLQKDYDKRLDVLDKEKQTEEKQTTNLKQKLQDKEQEITQLQQQIGELKAKIKKAHIKPAGNITKQEQQSVKQKPKMSPTKLKQSGNVTKTITDQTHIKYDEKGQATDKGQRFTDRNVLGKGTQIKIIGVRVWTEKNSFMINGIQCIYKIGENIKDGQQHINKDAKKYCTENLMEVPEGDYIKAVSGHLSQGNVIEYLVLISKNSLIGRFGMAKQTQKQFNFDIDEDEIPICMYGSISNTKQDKKQGSIMENLGFEICRDKSLNKDDKYI